MGASWGEVRARPCGPLTRTVPIYLERWTVWEDRPFLVQRGRTEQEDFLKKKKKKWKQKETLFGSLGNSSATTAPTPLHWPARCSRRGVWGTEPTSEAPGRVHPTEGPVSAPIALRRVHTWTCGMGAAGEMGWRLAKCWSEWRRAKLSPLSLLQSKRRDGEKMQTIVTE